jgi:hypothetical protein
LGELAPGRLTFNHFLTLIVITHHLLLTILPLTPGNNAGLILK